MIFPAFLKPGDKVGVVAPAGPVQYPDDIRKGIEKLARWGLFVIEGYSVSQKYFQFAGSDQDRLSDLQYMLDQPDIKAIIAVRGGYGTSRIIDELDFSGFRQHPKWIVGFSDLTLLLNHLNQMGYASIHGPMVKHIGIKGGEMATDALRSLLSGQMPNYRIESYSGNRIGAASGELIGGNLCLLAHSIGTPSEPSTDGKILFLEDVGEPLYNIDRMLWQLRRSGKLSNLKGLIAGQFTELKGTPETFGKDVYDIIADHVSRFGYPVAYGFPAGHTVDNRPLVIGATANLEVGSDVNLSFTFQK